MRWMGLGFREARTWIWRRGRSRGSSDGRRAAEAAVVAAAARWRRSGGHRFAVAVVVLIVVVDGVVGDAGRHRGASKEGEAGDDALKDVEIELGRGVI